MKYELVDHTADICIRCQAKNLSELFKCAAVALMDLLADRKSIEATEEIEIRIDAYSSEQLLVRWLNELLYYQQTKGIFFKDFDVSIENGTRLNATAYGRTYMSGNQEVKEDIKGVTYHNLKIKKSKDKLIAEIVIDI